MWENAPQSVVVFTQCMLRMTENPNTAALLQQVLGKKRGENSVQRQARALAGREVKAAGTQCYNLKRGGSHGVGGAHDNCPGQDFIQLRKSTMF